MYLEELKEKLANSLGVTATDFVYPPQANMGDLSLPLFNLAKKLTANPVELAVKLVNQLELDKSLMSQIDKVQAVGPYLNIYIKAEILAQATIEQIQQEGEKFGSNLLGQQDKVMIEYSNANTHKEYHVGHLRNLFFGDAVNKILAFSNYQVIPVSYINDFGIHVAKTLWGWQLGAQRDKWQEELAQGVHKGYLLGACYAAASQEISADEKKKIEVAAIMKEIETRQGQNYILWQETREWSIEYFDQIYKELGIQFDHIFYENELIEEGLKIVNDWLQKGILKKSEGAIIADLEKFDLGVLPIIRSDGTALYPVADLALAYHKFSNYALTESIYVVDVRQGLYFKQLAKIFEIAGEQFKISHLAYDFVTLKEGMMASRSGNVITYRQLLAEALEKARVEIAKRHEDWTGEKLQTIAFALAKAALKFEMLKVSSDKIIVFDVSEALRFEGYTAAYLQYTGARLASILRKAKMNSFAIANFSLLNQDKEKQLLLMLQKFTEAVKVASVKRDPSLVARYLFELTQLFNDYYHAFPVLKTEANLQAARLQLLIATQQVIKNAFNLLGLDYLEEM